jgi:hypothetical protein
MTNVNVSLGSCIDAAPLGGVANDGTNLIWVPSTAKAAQNDTITLVGATAVLDVKLDIVATGAKETATFSGNVITLTSATTGNVRGIVIYR